MLEFGTARADEIPELATLLGLLFAHEAEFSPDTTKQTRALELLLSDPTKGTVFVAREHGRAIGMASLLHTLSTVEGGAAALFEDLIVHPGHRHRGIATALVEFIIREARSRGIRRVTLLTDANNARAQALYRKLGFVDSSMKPMRLKL